MRVAICLFYFVFRLETIVSLLASRVNPETRTLLRIVRSRVWQSFKEQTDNADFVPQNTLDVIFVDDDGNAEGGVDLGGPSLELLTLLMEHVEKLPVWRREPYGSGMRRKYLVLNYEGNLL